MKQKSQHGGESQSRHSGANRGLDAKAMAEQQPQGDDLSDSQRDPCGNQPAKKNTHRKKQAWSNRVGFITREPVPSLPNRASNAITTAIPRETHPKTDLIWKCGGDPSEGAPHHANSRPKGPDQKIPGLYAFPGPTECTSRHSEGLRSERELEG